MGQRRPTRSEKIPAASCENPLRNEYNAMNASRRAPPSPSPSRAQLASRPQAMPVSKLAQKPATHTAARLRSPQVVRAKETERRSARKEKSRVEDASKSFSFSALIEDASRSRSASSSASTTSSSTNAPVFAASAMRASRDDRSSLARAESSVASSESAAARDASRDSRSAAAATPTPTAASAS